MAFDGIVTRALAGELKNRLTGGRVDKIYQPEEDQILLHIASGREKYRLFLSSDGNCPRACLTNSDYANPQNPMPFCMLLRKHIQNSRLREIRSVGSERILELYFDSVSELGYSVSHKLVFECMGKHSNILLVNLETGKIVDAIKRVSPDMSRVRPVLPGMVYEYPPAQEGKLSLEEFLGIFPKGVPAEKKGEALPPVRQAAAEMQEMQSVPETIKTIGADNPDATITAPHNRLQGISKSLGEELAALAGEGELPGEVNREGLKRVLAELVHDCLTGELRPVVYLDEAGTPKEFQIIPLARFEESLPPEQILRFDTVSEAIEYYYEHKAASNRMRQKSSDLLKQAEALVSKYELKKQKISEELLDAENSDKYRLYGELLTANLHLVSAGAEKARVLNYYTNEEIDIPLDPRFNPQKNAQRYFKKYGKAKTALREKTVQLKETEENLVYLRSVLSFASRAETPQEIEQIRRELVDGGYLRKRKDNFKSSSKSKLQPLRYTTGGGFTLLVGRNNIENDQLTLHTAEKRDIWFHTKEVPGSHVILVTGSAPESLVTAAVRRGEITTDNARKPLPEGILSEVEDAQKKESAVIEGYDLGVPAADLFEAASVAAYHSQAKAGDNVAVDYCTVRHVKKPAGAMPGMVIFTDNRTLYVKPGLPKGKDETDGTKTGKHEMR